MVSKSELSESSAANESVCFDLYHTAVGLLLKLSAGSKASAVGATCPVLPGRKREEKMVNLCSALERFMYGFLICGHELQRNCLSS